MRITSRLAAGLFVFGLAASAGAVPITYSWQGPASGFLDGQSFTDAQLTITAHADTNDVVQVSAVTARVFVGDAQVAVAGLGSDSLTGKIGVVRNGTLSSAGISNFDLGRAILFITEASLPGYDLTASFGPVSGTATTNLNFAFPTAGGSISFSHVDSATFQAVAVPEPGAALLMGCGLAALLAVASRRRAGKAGV